MTSAAVNRPSGTMSAAARSTRFGDFPSATNRMNPEEKTTQSTPLSQGFGSTNAWQSSSGIWGNNAIGSGFTNGKRDTSRSRVTEDETFHGPSGSGALTATSEADPWVSRSNGPWTVNTSPSQSGSTSPVRHRGSNSSAATNNILSESQKTSPYMTTSRPAIGQGPGLNGRSMPKSGLDPASGPFKYISSAFNSGDNKENHSQVSSNGLDTLDSYGLDKSFSINQSHPPRDASLPPSRHSEAGSTSQVNTSLFGSGGFPSFGHTPSNSIHTQRPSISSRTPSFPSISNDRSYSTQQDRGPESDSGYMRSQPSHSTTPSSLLDHHLSVADQQYSQSSGYLDLEQRQLNINGSSPAWNSQSSSASKGISNYLGQNYADGAFSGQLSSGKQSRTSDRESISPGIEYARSQPSPRYYGAAGTGEANQNYLRSQRAPAVTDLERDLQRLQFSQHSPYFSQHAVYGAQFQGQYTPHAYDYSPQAYRAAQQHYGYMPLTFPPRAGLPPRGPARDQDTGRGLRSILLEEFRSNSKSNKRYELKDIYNHVVEFSGDQHGSRFIQQKLETANSDEKDQLFHEIQPNALQLMTDVFGNYVIQKLFEHGNQVQKRLLAEQMRNHVNELSLQMYGCRVVQKALEHVLADQQAELVRELQPDILKCVKDQNGNHVVQKAIERVPAEHIQFIIEAFRGQVHTLATHAYGCRVIQRILEYCSEKDQAMALEELFACASMLITDQFGNYVVQHVIQHGKPEDRSRIIKIVTAQLLTLSKHKFASNVVEKSIQFGSDEQRKEIVAQLTILHSDGSSPLQLMMKDQYGNYVIQKLLGQLKGAERDDFVEHIKPQLLALKKYNYGKQIAAIEKLIFTNSPSQQPNSYASNMVPASVSQAPFDINSSVPTPMLTMEQNSPQSSSVPSTNASTVDGPTEGTGAKGAADNTTMPEVIIESV